ncbi:hypothetical protein PDESU_00606 [Pontiella desulfatans]|uniref:Lipoprotein SmpA/OmlA domain-containing protein n=1 Tax=Pontiella desulfatans TaxID=2750659 RepID=A0A6C2TWW6_PONDE|nr:hypothetical protein [Pontiella desulfatans]VGO12057.1 hypothetical protein PDESU_00606 [Pontiella desulfatans]
MTLSRRRMVALGAVSCLPGLGAFAAEKGTYFTTANIWYEVPQKIYSTNYHVGRIIPAGSEIEVSSISRNRVAFKVKGNDAEYLWTFFVKHSSLDFEKEFARLFSKTNTFSELAKKLDEKTLSAIQKGKVEDGMAREAVLASYGYPPSHRTPDLDDDVWVYWINRFKTRSVNFEDGKVAPSE